MKIRLYSDLHREFDGWDIPEIPDEQEYVLVLAGDIAVARKNNTWLQFLPEVAERHRAVVYVPGNHEYYGDSIDRAWQKIAEDWDWEEMHFLNDGYVDIDDVRIIGGTLWTDFNLNGNQAWAMRMAEQMMNDYRVINRVVEDDDGEYHYLGKLKPKDTLHLHLGTVGFIETILDMTPEHMKTMIVTHHGPTPQSIAPEFAGNNLNPAYVTDLTGLIRERKPDVWVHGHTHNTFQYYEGNTLVMTNPKGYPADAVWKGCDTTYENGNFRVDGLMPEIDKVLNRTKCPYGCIFDGNKLMGDCRAPAQGDCQLNRERAQ